MLWEQLDFITDNDLLSMINSIEWFLILDCTWALFGVLPFVFKYDVFCLFAGLDRLLFKRSTGIRCPFFSFASSGIIYQFLFSGPGSLSERGLIGLIRMRRYYASGWLICSLVGTHSSLRWFSDSVGAVVFQMEIKFFQSNNRNSLVFSVTAQNR